MKKIHLHLQSVPPYTPAGAVFYLAGNFNEWQPGDAHYRFKAELDGSFSLTFTSTLDALECKITRGEWSTAEGNSQGNEMPNRVFKTSVPESDLWLNVQSWTDLKQEAESHGASENVMLLQTDFPMPQLGRKRRIWAYLPPGYWNTQRNYPVVYMQDGQNLFDNPEAVFGSWDVDKALNRLFDAASGAEAMTPIDCIIIGIENGGEHRIAEYSPWPNPEHGGGEGTQYLGFLCDTLKPFVDQRLRTLPTREHTGIIGSSMGGLISLFAAIERPDIFGMAGVFSPSLWFSKEVFHHVARKKTMQPVKILLMAGQQESKTMVSDLLDLYETLLEAGHEDHNLHYDLHSDGTHAEWFWAREFEHAFRWLFGEMPQHRHGAASNDLIRFRLDEKAKQLLVQVDKRLRKASLEIRDYCHDRHFSHVLDRTENLIPYATWENCLYSIRLLSEGDLVFSRRVHLNQVEAA